MNNQELQSDQELLKAINESGFPLQLGLLQLVRKHQTTWTAILTEHHWIDPLKGDEKFIDLVLRQGSDDYPVRLVIECKRSRDTEWIFLREPSLSPRRARPSSVRSRVVIKPEESNHEEFWDVPFTPGYPAASYCVIRKNRQRTQELLERTAAELVRATDALAKQEALIFARSGPSLPSQWPGLRRVYVPVIVTTASLFVCDAPYDTLDLTTGEVGDVTVCKESVVHFTKSLVSFEQEKASATRIEQFSQQSERSVLIVRASDFLGFLAQFKFSNDRADLLSRLLPR